MPCPRGGCQCKYTIGYSDMVIKDYKRIYSLFNFIKRDAGDIGTHSLEIADHNKID